MSIYPFFEIQEEKVNKSAKEYDLKKGIIVSGADALKIWIENTLKIKRYVYPIYTFDYGHEFYKLIGRRINPNYVESEVKRYLNECLLINENIKELTDVGIKIEGSRLNISFTAVTVYGRIGVDV